MRRRSNLPAIASALLAVVFMSFVVVGCGKESAGPIDHRFVIPAGSNDTLDRGDSVVLMPPILKVTVGDTITIVNNDSVDQSIGPYFVGAGETLRQRFKTPGTLEGECAFTKDGEYRIEVAEPKAE